MIPWERIDAITERAYKAYGNAVDFKNFQGGPMPEWDALPVRIQVAWKHAVRKVVMDVKEEIDDLLA